MINMYYNRYLVTKVFYGMTLTSLKASRYKPKTRYFWIKDKRVLFLFVILMGKKRSKEGRTDITRAQPPLPSLTKTLSKPHIDVDIHTHEVTLLYPSASAGSESHIQIFIFISPPRFNLQIMSFISQSINGVSALLTWGNLKLSNTP